MLVHIFSGTMVFLVLKLRLFTNKQKEQQQQIIVYLGGLLVFIKFFISSQQKTILILNIIYILYSQGRDILKHSWVQIWYIFFINKHEREIVFKLFTFCQEDEGNFRFFFLLYYYYYKL